MPNLLSRRSLQTLLTKSIMLTSSPPPKYLIKSLFYPSRFHTQPYQVLPHCRTNLVLHLNNVTKSRFHSYGPSSNGVVPVEKEEIVQVQDGFTVDDYRILQGNLKKIGIRLGECKEGKEYRTLCPKCEGGSQAENSLSVAIMGSTEKWQNGKSVKEPIALFNCFRGKCGWAGKIGAYKAFSVRKFDEEYIPPNISKRPKRDITAEDLKLEKLCVELIAYFHDRGISKETLERNGVMQKDGRQLEIAFPYKREGKLVNVKYRSLDKVFRQEKGTETILYGLDDIKMSEEIIIVEGEIDKLSMEEAGFKNCVSVPDGAPAKVSEKELTPEQDKKFQYLWNSLKYFEKASRIILATDDDIPGQALAEEIARRLGKERCLRVKWPKRKETGNYKDANEVLMGLGKERLKEAIKTAELYPIEGLMRFSAYFSDIDAYYRHEGFELGVPTGWKALNPLYNVVPGELTIVSGVPNSGKSEWIDSLLCNINEKVGWKFVLCSMENSVREHARKLFEKHLRKPFFKTRYSESVDRMSLDELEQAKQWVDENFYLIRCENGSLPSIKWILTKAKVAVLRHGVRGLVIDPYNELEHQRERNQNETEYVSQMLTLVKRFAQHHSVHVWFVAHPKQMQNWNNTAPNLYDISGSAHFINKCDNGIVVHRKYREAKDGPMDHVQILVRKVRNKCIGGIGEALLSYDRVTGIYSDIE